MASLSKQLCDIDSNKRKKSWDFDSTFVKQLEFFTYASNRNEINLDITYLKRSWPLPF